MAYRLKERKQHTTTRITGTDVRNYNNASSLWCVGFFGGKRATTADSYGNEKLIRKWTKSVFFVYFWILWEREWSRFVYPNPVERFVTRLQTAAQPLLHLANNTAKTQIHNYLCQECGGYCQGYGQIEVHSFLLKRRESTLAARSEVLEMLDDDSPKVKWMRRVYPRVDYTPAP